MLFNYLDVYVIFECVDKRDRRSLVDKYGFITDVLTGIWKENRSKQKNFAEFLEVLGPDNFFLSHYKNKKCSYLTFEFDSHDVKKVKIKGSLGNPDGITREQHQFDYQITADNDTSYEMQPQHLGFALHQNVTFAIEGIKLTAFHKNDTLTNIIMDNPINFFIEWKAESLGEMTERWHHVPTNTEAISYYDRVENGITLEDVRKWYYNWCNN